jgi:CHAT domain-containing protein/tetratricopeptide (TPR) repeat protein
MPSAHPDAGLLAAHAEGRLGGAEAARMDEHLAGCSACHEVFAETLRFRLDEAAGSTLDQVRAGIVPSREPIALPFVRRPAFRLAAVLAVAATVVLAFQQLWLPRFRPGSSDPVAELVQAMGTTRFIEPRLTGGFQHGRYVVLRSSDKAQGLDAFPPAVIAAVARVREKTEGDSSPQALGAQALTFLVSGDVAKAVKALELATVQAPKDPRLLSDLSAAYLVRASRLDEPSDIPKALEAAERAIEIEGAPTEAWFNRALAIESLRFGDAARKAWSDYLERDESSPWAEEARRHIADLEQVKQSTIEEDRSRARAALAEGREAVERLAAEDPSILADYFYSELLPSLADAELVGKAEADVLRDQAQVAAQALFRTTGDALPRDTAGAPLSGSAALGIKALQVGERLLESGEDSCPSFRESRRLLEDGGSPYAAWARERVLVSCLYAKSNSALVPELSQLQALARQKRYAKLLGRALWMTALTQANAGDFDNALENYREAAAVYRELRDSENEAAVGIRRAHVLSSSGDSRSGWREGLRALALVGTGSHPTLREAAVLYVALASWHAQLGRSAIHALSELANMAQRRKRTDVLAYARIWRADIFQVLGSHERAVADMAEARSLLDGASDIADPDALRAFASAAEGRILAGTEPEKAIALLRGSLPWFGERYPPLAPALRVQVARVLRVRGGDLEAEAELDAAIRQLESQRSLMDVPEQRVLFFDYAAAAPFDEMVALQLDRRSNPVRALHYVERSRGRQLADSLLSRAPSGSLRVSTAAHEEPTPFALESLQRELPVSVALLYYLVMPDRVAAWVVSHDDARFFSLAIAPGELKSRVAAFDFGIETEAPVSAIREQAARLHDDLLGPLLPALRGRESLVLVADSFLGSLPFASLWNRRTGRHLVEDYTLVRATNGSLFVHASASAARFRRDRALRVLAVGNPRRAPGSDLEDLRASEIEAAQIARLYPAAEVLRDSGATKSAFVGGLRHSDVVHFAGHSTQGESLGSGRLLLAPEPGTGSSGVLRSGEIAAGDLRRTRLVVLAGCRTATGEHSRFEGALGVTRPFLAAGVPMVVASLWDVDDSASREFFLEFHRHFVSRADAATSVRLAQLAALRGADTLRSHPSKWAGFVTFGGILPDIAPAVKSRPAL